MKRTIFLSLTALLLIVSSSMSQAQGIPVYDAAGYAQVLTQLDQMTKDYQKQIEQLNEAIKQTGALTGSRDMGSLANSPLEAELRRYLPNTWQDTMHMMNAANLGSSATGTQGIYNNLTSSFNPVSGSAFVASDPSGPIAQALDRRTQTTYAAMAAGEQAFNGGAARTNTYESLLSELNNTTDLKASIDLLARISAENGMAVNEAMRLNAIQIQQKAAQDNEDLTSYARAHTANQYDPATAAKSFKLQE